MYGKTLGKDNKTALINQGPTGNYRASTMKSEGIFKVLKSFLLMIGVCAVSNQIQWNKI